MTPDRTALAGDDDAGVLDAAGGLEELTLMSLAKLKEILTLDLPTEALTELKSPGFKQALDLAKLQLGATERVLTTQTRVDETKLRRRQIDVLPRLLEILAEEKKALALMIEGEVQQ
ncbi:hypothetical protein SAMN05444161_5310 [Rhizobiales bacterium GAS191]|nr:hypothetical protein SAMN05444161_5310 [Rhizobiales bacterium GAS191]